MCYYRLSFNISLFSVVFFSFVYGIHSEAFSESKSSASDDLDFMVIKVNDESLTIFRDQELIITKGDKFVVEKAVLKNGRSDVEVVNIVGYSNSNETSKAEDRHIVVDTAFAHFFPRWSIDEKGTTYRITAYSKTRRLGNVYIKFAEPLLRYIVLSINDEKKYVAPDDNIEIKSTDKFKVEDIVLNIKTKKGVMLQVIPSTQEKKPIELRFSKGNKTFAKVPLQIKG